MSHSFSNTIGFSIVTLSLVVLPAVSMAATPKDVELAGIISSMQNVIAELQRLLSSQSVPSAQAQTTPPPPPSLYFNSSEPGGNGSDPNVLWCDGFERGSWFFNYNGPSDLLNA